MSTPPGMTVKPVASIVFPRCPWTFSTILPFLMAMSIFSPLIPFMGSNTKPFFISSSTILNSLHCLLFFLLHFRLSFFFFCFLCFYDSDFFEDAPQYFLIRQYSFWGFNHFLERQRHVIHSVSCAFNLYADESRR